jgi:hypothetical protein
MEIINDTFLYIKRGYAVGYVLIKINDIICIEDEDEYEDNKLSKIYYNCLDQIQFYTVKHSVKEIKDFLQKNIKNN